MKKESRIDRFIIPYLYHEKAKTSKKIANNLRLAVMFHLKSILNKKSIKITYNISSNYIYFISLISIAGKKVNFPRHKLDENIKSFKTITVPKFEKTRALKFFCLFGIIGVLVDIIYEKARSVNGQYLVLLGVSCNIVGLLAGIGELLGYVFRLASGFFSDILNFFWIFRFLDCVLLISDLFLSLTDCWLFLSFLFILEKIGKVIRLLAKDIF